MNVAFYILPVLTILVLWYYVDKSMRTVQAPLGNNHGLSARAGNIHGRHREGVWKDFRKEGKMTDTTSIFIVAALVIIIGYDVYAAIKGGEPNTISWKIVFWSRTQPLIPFAAGLLMGHLFFANHAVCP